MVDVGARLHQKHKVDFRKARRLANNDGLFVWTKGYQQSDILSPQEWAQLPPQITGRVIRFTTAIRGHRVRRITLVTSLLDPALYPTAFRPKPGAKPVCVFCKLIAANLRRASQNEHQQ